MKLTVRDEAKPKFYKQDLATHTQEEGRGRVSKIVDTKDNLTNAVLLRGSPYGTCPKEKQESSVVW